MRKKLILIILLVIVGIISVVGITYAIYTWAMSEDVTGVAECFEIDYVKGSDIGSANENRVFMPSNDYTGGLVATVIVRTNPKCTITNGIGTLYLNTDSATSEILLTSGALKYQVIENSITKIANGTVSSTGELPIYSNFNVTTEYKQYTVSVWIDSSMMNDSNTEDILASSYIGNISMKVESGDIE